MKKAVFILAIITIMALMLVACGGDSAAPEPTEAPSEPAATALPAGDAANGEKLFNTTCIACHGAGGVGVQGLGKDMTHSEFIAGLSDAEMLTFVKTGRPSSDPLNTTGIDMPPKGGNPALSDEQILDIIAYIRTIHQ